VSALATDHDAGDDRQPVGLPAPDEVPSFSTHIKPLFRTKDRQAMRFASTSGPTKTRASTPTPSSPGSGPAPCPATAPGPRQDRRLRTLDRRRHAAMTQPEIHNVHLRKPLHDPTAPIRWPNPQTRSPARQSHHRGRRPSRQAVDRRRCHPPRRSDGVARSCRLRLLVGQRLPTAGKVQPHQAVFLGCAQPA
jgi:hypothetical protein